MINDMVVSLKHIFDNMKTEMQFRIYRKGS